MAKIYENVIEMIGNTPLVRINQVGENKKVNFYQKIKKTIMIF